MISVIYCTNRHDPKFDWFFDSLWNQTTEDERKDIEIIVVDSAKEVRGVDYSSYFESKGAKWVLPKPNIYQGANRRTKTEMFSPSNARNTGILLSNGEYLVFADDVAVLMPSWWGAVKEAAQKKMIVCGSYQKHSKMIVENGILVSSESNPMGRDSRWNSGSDIRPVLISGQSLFGCSLGIPASDIIAVNGFDEICDSIGGEDYHLGMRLNNTGRKVHYDRRMYTVESEELHNQPYLMLRQDRVLRGDAYMLRLAEFGVKKRHYIGNWDSSHMILDLLYGLRQTWTLGNNYNLGVDREHHYFFPPHETVKHWFDGMALSEI